MKGLSSTNNQNKRLRYGWMLLFVLGISLSHTVLNNTYAQSPLTTLHALPTLSALITSPAIIERLLAKVPIRGTVEIIVGLRLDNYESEGYLLPEIAQIQRQAITEAQNRLLARMALHKIKFIVKFEHIPFVAMEVDEATLKALIVDPEVKTIEENIAIPLALERAFHSSVQLKLFKLAMPELGKRLPSWTTESIKTIRP